MQQLYPVAHQALQPTTVYSLQELAAPESAAKRLFVRFNMVSSVDGKIVTAAGNAAGLGSKLDHFMMYRLRAASDAILVGAETFRHDPFVPNVMREANPANHPLPIGIILSRDGNLPLDKKFFTELDFKRRFVALGDQASDAAYERLAPHTQIIRVPTQANMPDVEWLLNYLYERLGIQVLLCEGGPFLNSSLIAKNLIDELFLTFAPKLVGGDNAKTILGGSAFEVDQMPNLELVSIYEEASELFFRYRRHNALAP